MKRLLLALAFSALVSLTASAQLLVNFGAAAFTPDSDLSDFATITQSASSVSVAGFDHGQTLAGTFASPVDFSAVTTLYLTASVEGTAPDSTFTVLLFNSDFSQTRTYESAFNTYSVTSASYALSFVAEDSGFADIAGFQLIANGVGAPLAFTLENLAASPSAIPEPSTYAALLAAVAFCATVIRRRMAHLGDNRSSA
jgi:hypothetical protein